MPFEVVAFLYLHGFVSDEPSIISKLPVFMGRPTDKAIFTYMTENTMHSNIDFIHTKICHSMTIRDEN
jgi:hypothetical protein